MKKKNKTAEELEADALKKNKGKKDEEQDEDLDDEEDADEGLDPLQDDEDNDDEDEELDYKALADAETKRADEAVQAAADLAYKLRNKKRKNKDADQDDDDDASDDEDEDKPLTAKDLKQFESRIVNRTQKQYQEAEALIIARSLTNNDEAQARAVVTFWQTRVQPTGNLHDDVSFAFGGLNHKKITAKNSELRRALNNKDTVNDNASNGHRDGMITPSPKLAPDMKLSLSRAGYKFDPKAKVFKKKLPNGKFHLKDAGGKTLGFSAS